MRGSLGGLRLGLGSLPIDYHNKSRMLAGREGRKRGEGRKHRISAIRGERTRLSDSSTAWIRLRRSQSQECFGGLLQIAQFGSILVDLVPGWLASGGGCGTYYGRLRFLTLDCGS